MVYAAIGGLAVQNFKPSPLNDLKDTQERCRTASGQADSPAMVLANNRFHEIFGEMSANAYLRPGLGRLLIDHARMGHTFFRPRNEDMKHKLAKAVAHHDDFIYAPAGHDEDAVVRRVFEHWELSRTSMELFVAAPELKADAMVGRAFVRDNDTAPARHYHRRRGYQISKYPPKGNYRGALHHAQ